MNETFIVAAAVFLRVVSNPLANVFQKKLTAHGVHPLFINFITYLALAAICVFLFFQIPIPPLSATFWLYSALAGIAGALGNSLLISALKEGDLSVLGPINSYKAVVGILGAMILLGEFPDVWGLLGMALIIGGSYFVLDTTDARFSWNLLRQRAIQYRIAALVLTAIEAVFIKKIILASSTLVSLLSWCWGGAFFSLLLLPFWGLHPVAELNKLRKHFVPLILGVVSAIGVMQLTTNYVFNHMPVAYALSLFQLSVLASVLLGYRIFQEQGLKKKLVGSCIMILGSALIALS